MAAPAAPLALYTGYILDIALGGPIHSLAPRRGAGEGAPIRLEVSEKASRVKPIGLELAAERFSFSSAGQLGYVRLQAHAFAGSWWRARSVEARCAAALHSRASQQRTRMDLTAVKQSLEALQRCSTPRLLGVNSQIVRSSTPRL